MAVREEIVITRHGRPAGVLIGFESEEEQTMLLGVGRLHKVYCGLSASMEERIQ